MNRLVLAACLSLICAAAFSQSVSTTVRVENDYKSNMMDFPKKGLDLVVPDSLTHFDYKFDYSVFERQFKGSYDFSPYRVNATPCSSLPETRRFSLRAGAGYSLHPELSLVWAPVQKEAFNMSVFADASGYYGPYMSMGTDLLPKNGDWFNACDFVDNAGAEFRWNFSGCDLRAEIGYDGLFSTGLAGSSLYNSGYVDTWLKSNSLSRSYFFYDLSVKYRYSNDGLPDASSHHDEHFIKAEGSMGPVFRDVYRFLVDFDVESDIYSICREDYHSDVLNFIGLNPHFQFAAGPVEIDAGVNVDYSDRFSIYPDVHAELPLEKARMALYADIIGTDNLNTYHSYKMNNHRFTDDYAPLSFSRDVFNARIGMRGHLGKHLIYDVNGGYDDKKDTPLPWVVRSTSDLLETFVFHDLRMTFCNALMSLVTERLDADIDLSVRSTLFDGFDSGFNPPLVSGSFKAEYNWSRRLFAGISLSGQSLMNNRAGVNEQDIPGWIDLGINSEYKFMSGWSLWAKATNVLGQPVRQSILYIEKAPAFTLGICMDF